MSVTWGDGGDWKPTAVRWLKFNAVGAAGVAVQLGTLSQLLAVGLNAFGAAAVAVEAALIHNFLWHETWTWGDRGTDKTRRLGRLLRFHGANGAVSLVGNLVVMAVLVRIAGVSPLPANAIAIGACGLVNFALGDRWVFAGRGGDLVLDRGSIDGPGK